MPSTTVPRPAARTRSVRILASVLIAVGLAVAGCSSSADQDPVTVTRVVAGTDAPSGEPTTRTTASTAGPTADASSGPVDPTPEESTAENTEPSTADNTSQATSSRQTSTSRTTGAGVPTENAPDASPDTAGPETGPACATDAKYVDEPPTGLRSDVVTGWRSIEKAANADGVIVCLNDGKRSRAQQQAQYDQYEEQYGKEVADQLVLPPSKSAHVIGNAIDVQPQAAYQWLQATKGSLGFCRIYDNEPWHFEYDVQYFTAGCPARLPKPQR